MFNFKKYPELIPYHKKWVKMNKKLSHLVNLSVDKDNESAGIKADKLYEELREFDKEYGQKVYELLKDVKPKLLNDSTKKYEDWDTVVEHFKSKNTGNGLVFLSGSVEADGLYLFPPEYYDPDLTDKTL